MLKYYDREGDPISYEEWLEKFETPGYQHIAKTELDGGVMVSTIWLGMNHQYNEGGPPIIFETIIFEGEHDQEMWRYSTFEEALADHHRIVQALKDGVDPNKETEGKNNAE